MKELSEKPLGLFVACVNECFCLLVFVELDKLGAQLGAQLFQIDHIIPLKFKMRRNSRLTKEWKTFFLIFYSNQIFVHLIESFVVLDLL